MLRTFLLAAMVSCGATTAYAATWNVLFAGTAKNTMTFFDSDSVTKHDGKVTVWEEYVNRPNHPEKDGSYSAVAKTVYDCRRKTMQVLTTITYDQNREFMRSYPPERKSEIIPGSVSEQMLKVICERDFPHNKSLKDYGPVDGDVDGYAKSFFGVRAAKVDSA